MVLRTVNEVFECFGSDSGKPIKNTYMRQDNEDGSRELVKTGEKNVQEEIDSYAEQTDYTKLLERMEKGDPVAAATATQIITPAVAPVFGDDSAEISLRKIADARLTAKRVFDAAGGEKALGLSFEQFLSTAEVQQIVKRTQKPEPEVVNVNAENAVKSEGGVQNEQK